MVNGRLKFRRGALAVAPSKPIVSDCSLRGFAFVRTGLVENHPADLRNAAASRKT